MGANGGGQACSSLLTSHGGSDCPLQTTMDRCKLKTVAPGDPLYSGRCRRLFCSKCVGFGYPKCSACEKDLQGAETAATLVERFRQRGDSANCALEIVCQLPGGHSESPNSGRTAAATGNSGLKSC
jgi:hypothetical protein